MCVWGGDRHIYASGQIYNEVASKIHRTHSGVRVPGLLPVFNF